MADESSDFSFDDVVAQLDDLEVETPRKTADAANTIEESVVPSESLTAAGEQAVEPETVAEAAESESVDAAAESKVESESADESDSVHENAADSSVAVEVDEKTDDSLKEENSVEANSDEPSSEDGTVEFNPLDSDSVGKFLEEMGVPAEIVECKKVLIGVMQRENDLLDEILAIQSEIHDSVREKNWEPLNEKLESLQDLSDTFANLEEERELLCKLIDIRSDADFSPVLTQVRGKLQRSKIENHALNEYVSTTRKFLQGVFDSAVPQRKNVLYSKDGKLVRQEMTGVAVNIET